MTNEDNVYSLNLKYGADEELKVLQKYRAQGIIKFFDVCECLMIEEGYFGDEKTKEKTECAGE